MAGPGGPWGGGGNSGGGRGSGDGPGRGGPDRPNGGRRPGEGPNIPEIDDLVRKGQDQLRVLMGGRGGGPRRPNGGGGGPGFEFNRTTVGIIVAAALGFWAYQSFYTVRPEERSVELFLGEFQGNIGQPGLNFAPWPLVTAEVIQVVTERSVEVGGGTRDDQGLMLTGDENIVDVDFQVVWNISDPARYLFNLRDPELSVRAVSESAMREIVARSQLAPILNRDRGIIADELRELVQSTLTSYEAGVNIIRVNFDRADPPEEVIDAFRNVQAAAQQRDRLQSEADAYANRVLATARGEAAQILEQAEGYRARVVNEAEGEASRFSAVLTEYALAPDVTRKRLYLETMEQVLGDVDKIIVDNGLGGNGGQGIVPYLPLNELRGGRINQGGSN